VSTDIIAPDCTHATVTPQSLGGRHIINAGLWAAVLGPPVFLFFAIQYSAITLPFWDHVELGRLMIQIHDEGFRLHMLWAPENHGRPLTYRLILLANAWLTRWDIRSEYVYVFGAIYGAFLLQFFILKRISRGLLNPRFLPALALLSLLSFSPAGHNNHWWSLMLILNLGHFFILVPLFAIALAPTSWKANLFSIMACWVATYTFTAGLVAFLAAAIVAQLFGSDRPGKFSLRSAIWLSNIVLVLYLYLPGLPPNGGKGTPTFLDLIKFGVVYLGAPVADLISYPFKGQFYVPPKLFLPGLIGTVLCILAVYFAVIYWDRLRQQESSALIFFSLALFAFGVAGLTAWGRAAFDDYGIKTANSSRYTTFGTYLSYAFVYLFVVARENTHQIFTGIPAARRRKLCEAALGLFIVAASVSYFRSVHIYKESHAFNQLLSHAYLSDKTPEDKFIYPNAEVTDEFKRALKRVRLGPYSNLPEEPITAH
jgi:hypothetical protein